MARRRRLTRLKAAMRRRRRPSSAVSSEFVHREQSRADAEFRGQANRF